MKRKNGFLDQIAKEVREEILGLTREQWSAEVDSRELNASEEVFADMVVGSDCQYHYYATLPYDLHELILPELVLSDEATRSSYSPGQTEALRALLQQQVGGDITVALEDDDSGILAA